MERAALTRWMLGWACLLATLCSAPPGRGQEADLERGFAQPPDSAKPWAYWWWLDSYATKEGITRDLEEMKRQGIAGALIFDAGVGGPDAPDGPVFMSPAWRELFKFAVAEADRLGIETSINLCSGWNAGGTWVKPEHAAQKLVWSQTALRGPAEVSQVLSQPATVGGYYRDVAVLAFKTTEDLYAAVPKLTASSSYPNYPPANAADGNPETRWISNGDKPGMGPRPDRPEFICLEFPEPFAAASLLVVPYPDCGPDQCELQSSADGKSFQAICRFSVEAHKPKTVAFDEVRARFFRLVITSSHPLQGKACWNVQIGELALLKKGQKPEIPTALCESKAIVDLTGKTDAAGRLAWQAPEGTWMILRFGHTLLGARTICTSPGSQGLEIDPLSAEAMDMHFAATAEKLVADIGPLAGKNLKYTHIDSWELAGNPNWSTRFRDEFKRRRGYDPLPFLPALAGKTVDSPEISARFLWDHRRTLSDCIADHYYGRLSELSRRHGMGIHPESGGPGVNAGIDALQILGRSDIPMGEFWARQDERTGHFNNSEWTIKQAASAAHIYGRRYVQAEAFTTMGPNWEKDPFMLKDIGDRAFCCGVNRAMLCFYVHQPRLDILPGYQWEAAGTHFDRNITWWNQCHAWLRYLARCQFLLQQGLFAADVCYFYSEDVPSVVPTRNAMNPPLPLGCDCDTANAEVILTRMSVRDGRIVLPDGMSYHLLVLPPRQTMRPEVLKKIAELIEAGATVTGPKPVRAPGLTGYPDCDRQVRELAGKLWGACDGQAVKESKFGKGRIIWGKSLQEILLADGLGPDFQFKSGQRDAALDFIHRRTADAEIYFVANLRNRPEEVVCTFRVAGKAPTRVPPSPGGRAPAWAPELWLPDTGEIRRQPVYDQTKEGIALPLRFEPRGSAFVVFRKPAGGNRIVAIARDGKSIFPVPLEAAGPLPSIEVLPAQGEAVSLRAWQAGEYELKDAQGKLAKVKVEAAPPTLELQGPWTIRFPKGWGAPESTVLEKLISWPQHDRSGIKYFSGTATYQKEFDLPAAMVGKGADVVLDLGEVLHVAEVRLNGKDLGVVWQRPFRVDITSAVKPGRNVLEVSVTNLWPNRLIGDQFLPPDKRFTHTNVKKFTKPGFPLMDSGLLGPVRVLAAERRALVFP